MQLEMAIKMVSTNLLYIGNFSENRFFKRIFFVKWSQKGLFYGPSARWVNPIGPTGGWVGLDRWVGGIGSVHRCAYTKKVSKTIIL